MQFVKWRLKLGPIYTYVDIQKFKNLNMDSGHLNCIFKTLTSYVTDNVRLNPILFCVQQEI